VSVSRFELVDSGGGGLTNPAHRCFFSAMASLSFGVAKPSGFPRGQFGEIVQHVPAHHPAHFRRPVELERRFELLGRYEASLRRQLRQTLFTLGRILWRPTARNYSECNLLGIKQFESLLMMIQ
jgi:hypothetical protein